MEQEIRKVGETALQKTVRRLDEFNRNAGNPDVEGMQQIYIILRRDGSGKINGNDGRVLYGFRSIAQMTEFFDAPLSRQIQLMKENNR